MTTLGPYVFPGHSVRVGLDTDSEEELNEAIMGFALELKNLFP